MVWFFLSLSLFLFVGRLALAHTNYDRIRSMLRRASSILSDVTLVSPTFVLASDPTGFQLTGFLEGRRVRVVQGRAAPDEIGVALELEIDAKTARSTAPPCLTARVCTGDYRDLIKELRRLRRAIRALEVEIAPPHAISTLTATPTSGLRCPYCHDALNAEASMACTGCNTPHHAACYREAGGCTIHGCRQRPGVVAA